MNEDHVCCATTQVLPDPSLNSLFFWNSGAEAVEAAIKLARHATGKPNVIVAHGGYHGRTFGTMALTTSKTIYRAGFGPLMPGIHVTPFPYARQACPLVMHSHGNGNDLRRRMAVRRVWTHGMGYGYTMRR
jgi:4-aminobutyrate aminotransferase-like enzyme